MVKKKIQYKTKTLFVDADNPSVTIYPGHVTAREFNAGFRKEGWARGDWISKASLKHTWMKKRGKRYYAVKEGTKGARKYTAMQW